MLIYLIAGEPSGDTLGARLIKALKEENKDIKIEGIGGEQMQKEGLNSLFDIKDLAVMGLAEVIPSIPKVLARIKQTVSDIKEKKPDVVVTIDSWSFCARIHKALRKKGIKTRQIHYVAPQVWAWKKGRAKTMYKYIDCLLTLFPNEPEYFTPHHLNAFFCGHPAIEGANNGAAPEVFYKKYNIPENKKIILLLPGSRRNEVTRLLPPFLEAAEILDTKYNDLQFVLPVVKTVEQDIREMLAKQGKEDIIIVNDSNDRKLAMRSAAAAIAASGTVSLELAIADVPHLIGYKVSPLTAFIARRFLKIWSVNLPNILLNERVVPELLQENCNPENIARTLGPYIKTDNSPERRKFLEHQAKLKDILGMGSLSPSKTAAKIILNEALKLREM